MLVGVKSRLCIYIYIEAATFENLDGEYEEIIAMLNSMEDNAKKFCF